MGRMRNLLENALGKNPIISAIHSLQDAKDAAASSVEIGILLGGRIPELRHAVQIMRDKGKKAFVHLDLAGGLKKDEEAVQLLATLVKPDGIMTTKSSLIRTIRELGLVAGQRCFILDTQSYQVAVKTARACQPDFVELMPGLMPTVVTNFCRDTEFRVVAGGLVTSVFEAQQVFAAGASGISTSSKSLWSIHVN